MGSRRRPRSAKLTLADTTASSGSFFALLGGCALHGAEETRRIADRKQLLGIGARPSSPPIALSVSTAARQPCHHRCSLRRCDHRWTSRGRCENLHLVILHRSDGRGDMYDFCAQVNCAMYERIDRGSGSTKKSLRLDDQLCFSIYAAAHAFTRFIARCSSRWAHLPAISGAPGAWEEDRRLPVKAIGERLLLDSGTLTPLIKRTEEPDLVTRLRDSADERRVIVSLTTKAGVCAMRPRRFRRRRRRRRMLGQRTQRAAADADRASRRARRRLRAPAASDNRDWAGLAAPGWCSPGTIGPVPPSETLIMSTRFCPHRDGRARGAAARDPVLAIDTPGGGGGVVMAPVAATPVNAPAAPSLADARAL